MFINHFLPWSPCRPSISTAGSTCQFLKDIFLCHCCVYVLKSTYQVEVACKPTYISLTESETNFIYTVNIDFLNIYCICNFNKLAMLYFCVCFFSFFGVFLIVCVCISVFSSKCLLLWFCVSGLSPSGYLGAVTGGHTWVFPCKTQPDFSSPGLSHRRHLLWNIFCLII